MRSLPFFLKSRLWGFCGLLFLLIVFSGFSLHPFKRFFAKQSPAKHAFPEQSSNKNSFQTGGRSFPLPGSFEDVWDATLAVLSAERIPLAAVEKANGYIQSTTFPLYKKEYQDWAKAPGFSSGGFCALEIGIVAKDPTLTVVGIKAYFKQKPRLLPRSFRKKDETRGVFEGLLGKKIHEKLIGSKYPEMRHIILGCDLRYDDKTARYFVAGADLWTFAYEQGLRNGDVLLKIDGQDVTPGFLFDFLRNIPGESRKRFTLLRKEGEVELPVSIFRLGPEIPVLGFRVGRDPRSLMFKVSSVRPGSAAERMGLMPGDILIRQNGFWLADWKNYYRAILTQKAGESQTFEIQRFDQKIEKTIPRSQSI